MLADREIWNANTTILPDVDGDGHPDLLFGNYSPDGHECSIRSSSSSAIWLSPHPW